MRSEREGEMNEMEEEMIEHIIGSESDYQKVLNGLLIRMMEIGG